MSTEQASTFLAWTAPGDLLTIRLDYVVIQRINIEVMRGFGVTRRRGTETGGLLIGKIDRSAKPPIVHIQNFEVVPCEYASGPSYVLSVNDRALFEEAAHRWKPSLDRDFYTVGYFRSHTRDGFAFDEKDAALFREFLSDPLDVALLIKPFATRPATAGFALQEDGRLATIPSGVEFTFEGPSQGRSRVEPETVPMTVTGSSVSVRAPAESPQQPARARHAERRTPTFEDDRQLFGTHAQDSSRWPARLSWMAFIVALLAFGGVCGYEYALSKHENLPAAQGRPEPQHLYAIGLEVVEGDGILRVRWNRTSHPIQSAMYGILTITEGAQSKEVRLGFTELRNGTALYPNVESEVRFRLELFFQDNRSFVEFIDYKQTAR